MLSFEGWLREISASETSDPATATTKRYTSTTQHVACQLQPFNLQEAFGPLQNGNLERRARLRCNHVIRCG